MLFRCELCNTFCTSQKALDLHMLSAVHKANIKEEASKKEREKKNVKSKDTASTTRSSTRLAVKKPNKSSGKDNKSGSNEKKDSSKGDQSNKSTGVKFKEQLEGTSEKNTSPKPSENDQSNKAESSKITSHPVAKVSEQDKMVDLDEDMLLKDEYTIEMDDEQANDGEETSPDDLDMVIIDDSSDSVQLGDNETMNVEVTDKEDKNADSKSDHTEEVENSPIAEEISTKEQFQEQVPGLFLDQSNSDAVSVLKLLVDEVNKASEMDSECSNKRKNIESNDHDEVKKLKLDESATTDRVELAADNTEDNQSDLISLKNDDNLPAVEEKVDEFEEEREKGETQDDKPCKEEKIEEKKVEKIEEEKVDKIEEEKIDKIEEEKIDKIEEENVDKIEEEKVDESQVKNLEAVKERKNSNSSTDDKSCEQFGFKIVDVRSIAEDECVSDGGTEDLADLMDGDWEVKDELDDDECVFIEQKNVENITSNESDKEDTKKTEVEIKPKKRFAGPKSVMMKLQREIAQRNEPVLSSTTNDDTSTSKPDVSKQRRNNDEKQKKLIQERSQPAETVRLGDFKKPTGFQLISRTSREIRSSAGVSDENFVSKADCVSNNVELMSKKDVTEGISLVFSSEINSLDLDNVSEDEAKMTDTVSETSLLDDVSEFSDLPATSDISDVDIDEIEKILDKDEMKSKSHVAEVVAKIAPLVRDETTQLSEALKIIAKEAKIKPLSVTLKRLDEFTLKSWAGVSSAKLVKKSLTSRRKSGLAISKNRIFSPEAKIESVKKAWDRIISEKKELHKKKMKSMSEDDHKSQWDAPSCSSDRSTQFEKFKVKQTTTSSQALDPDDISRSVLASAMPGTEVTPMLVNYRIPKKSLKPKNVATKKTTMELKGKEFGKKTYQDDSSSVCLFDKNEKRKESAKDVRDWDRIKKDSDKVRKDGDKDVRADKARKGLDDEKNRKSSDRDARITDKNRRDVDDRRPPSTEKRKFNREERGAKRSREKEIERKSDANKSDKLPIKYVYQKSKSVNKNLIVVSGQKNKSSVWNKSRADDFKPRWNRKNDQPNKPSENKKDVSPIDYFSDYWKVTSKPTDSGYNRRRGRDSRSHMQTNRDRSRDEAQSRVYKTDDGGYWRREISQGIAAEGRPPAVIQEQLMRASNVQPQPGCSNWSGSQEEMGLSKSAIEAKTSLEDLLACLLTIPTLEQIDKGTTENIKRSILGKLSNHLQELKSAQLQSLNINLRPSPALSLQKAGRNIVSSLDLSQLNMQEETRNQLQMQMNQQQHLAEKPALSQDVQLGDYQKQQIAQELAAILTVTGRTEVSEDLLQRLVQQAIATKVTTPADLQEQQKTSLVQDRKTVANPGFARPTFGREHQTPTFESSRDVNPIHVAQQLEVEPGYGRQRAFSPSFEGLREDESVYDHQREMSPVFGRPSHAAGSAYERPLQERSPIFDRSIGGSPPYERPSRAISPNFGRSSRAISPNFNRPVRAISPNFGRPSREDSPDFNRQLRAVSPHFNRPPRQDSPCYGRPSRAISPNFNRPSGADSPNFNRPSGADSPIFIRQVEDNLGYERPRGFIPNFDRRREDSYSGTRSHSSFHSDNDSLFDADSNNLQDLIVSPANSFSSQQFGTGSAAMNRNFVNVAPGSAYNRPYLERERMNLMSVNVNPSSMNYEMNVNQTNTLHSQDRLKWPYHHAL